MHTIVKSNSKRLFFFAHTHTHTHTHTHVHTASSIYAPLWPGAHQYDIWCAKHMQWRVFSFCIFCSYSNLHIVQGCRYSWHVNLTCHKATQVFTSADHRGQELEVLSPTVAHATACSALLSAHCRCVMAVCHVEKHLVCLRIDGALITFLTCCSR